MATYCCEDTGKNTNVYVADRTDSIVKCRIRAQNAPICDRKNLKVHVWRCPVSSITHISSWEQVNREEIELGALETSCQNDNIRFHMLVRAFRTLTLSASARIPVDTVFVETDDVTTLVIGLTLSDVLE